MSNAFIFNLKDKDHLGALEIRESPTMNNNSKSIEFSFYSSRESISNQSFKFEGYKFFCIQCLTGDSTDNIPGLYKITGKRAKKCLKDEIKASTTPQACWEVVRQAYGEDHFLELLVTAELLYILQA